MYDLSLLGQAREPMKQVARIHSNAYIPQPPNDLVAGCTFWVHRQQLAKGRIEQ
jgi:hypothetical protein